MASSTLAAAALCLVVGVHDGDTATVRCGEAEQQRIRLAEIDAPELRQAHGKAAKHALSDLIFQQQVHVEPLTTDRYGRTIARVRLAERDVQWAMVAAGYAWCYRDYLERQECLDIERAAAAARRGLWAAPDAVPPWEFRRK